MADGVVTIDIDMPLDKFKSDMQLAESLLKKLGDGAGSEMDSDFKKASSNVVNEAKDVKKDVDAELKKPTATITPKVDDSDAQKGTQKIITSLRKLPKEQKVKLDADAKKAGIDDFTTLLKKVPKKTQTEILTKTQKGEVIDYEDLLKKVPKKVATEAKLNDNASPGLKNLQNEATETESKFAKLKTIIAGTFVGNLAVSAFGAVKDAIGGVIQQGAEYNRLQQTMNASWLTLTGSASEGKKLVDMTNQLATSAQNSTEMVNDLNQKFYATTNNADKTRELSQSVLTLQDAFGQSDEAVKNFSIQWSQMVGNGKASAQDMLSIQNVFPKFRQELLEYEKQVTNNSELTMSQLNDMMSAGEISADAMNTVLINMGEKYKDATKNFGETLDGMERTIKARIPILAGKLVEPFQNLQNPLLGKMSDWINSSGAEKAANELGKVLSGTVNNTMSVIDNTISMFSVSVRANIAGALDGKELSQGLSDLKKSFDNVMEAIKPIEQAIGGLLGVITGGAFSVAVDLIKGLASGFGLTGDEADKAKGKMDFSGVARIFTTVSQALNTVLTFVKPVSQALGEVAGIIAKSAFATFVDVLNGIGKALGEAFDKISSLIPALGDAGDGMSAIAKHEGALKAVGVAIAGIGTAIVAIKGAKAIFDGVSAGISALSNVTKIATGIQAAFNAVMALNPAVLIAGAVIALGVAIYEAYKHFKPFRDAVNGAWDAIKKFGSSVAKIGKQIYNGIVDGLSGVISWIKKWAKNIGDSIVKGFNSVMKPLSKVWDGIKKAAEIAFKAIGVVILAPIVLVSATIVAIWKKIHKPLETAWNAISKTASKVWNGIKKTTERIWNGIKDAVVKVANAIFKPVQKAFSKLGNWIGDKWDSIKKFTSEKWGHVKDIVGKMSEKAKDVGGKYLEVLKKDVGNKWDTVKSVTSSAWSKVSSYVGEHTASARDKASKNFGALRDSMSNILDSISKSWKRVWSNISDYFAGIWDGIKKSARNGLNDVIGFLNGGIGGINNVVHFFGGKKQTISPIPKLAKGGRMSKSTLALVNDEESPTYREAIFRRDGSVELPQERNVLTHLETGDAVMPAKQTAMLLGLPQYKGGFGDWLGKAADWVGDVSGDIGEWLADKIDQLEDALKNPLSVLMGLFKKNTNTAEAVWHDIGEGAGKYVPESAVDWFKNILAGFKKKFDESGGSNPPGEGVERWRGSVKKALAKLGLSTSADMVNKVLRQIQTESGGNPNAKQPGADPDGDGSGPALGLMQTKRGTFDSNALPGHRNLWNGFDNILAGLNYAKKRYGDSLYFLGQGHGYANGGHVYDKQLAWIAEDGDEFVINNRKPNADSLLASAIKQRAEINPNSFSAKIAHIIDSAKFSGSNGYSVAPQVNQATSFVSDSNSRDGSISIEGDTVIKVQLDTDTIAQATYPKHKLIQSREITISANGGAIPIV